ncbi:MAG: type III PLP-dependent enzyme [Syntrophothermus sp.]|uniref:type III PLP-dependent enzyme n=1 Tax=Syntrophothermus sp. TaxID=2736299 RepID=UPI00257B75BD|nr:type III PLP-dependent enzyme [Syntrophothermus sp.]NSW83320.1 type III PLP-dependent enzyme [Syntrophothermus sp.]
MLRLSFDEAKKLKEKWGTPLMVVSRREIGEKFAILNDYLPGVKMYYAVKANAHPDVLKTVKEFTDRFDICSPQEILAAKSIGVQSENMIHTNPVKKPEDIRFAVEQGVRWFVFDNEYELEKFKSYGSDINLLLRLSFPNPDCVVNLSYKYGVPPDEATGLVIKAAEMGLAVRGLCFHVGSQNLNPYKYTDAIAECKRVFNSLALHGIYLDYLDIGGGFPVEYIEPIMPLRRFFSPIQEALDSYFPNITVIAEPGRFIIGDAVNLVMTVVGKSKRNNVWWYYVDDGLYGSFSGRLYDHCDYLILSEREGPREQCIIAGPTCDSFDVIYHNTVMPQLEIGETLIALSMGAYTTASSSNFNGYPPARTVIVD